MRSITYQDSGVNYGAMDPFKRMCQLAASETDGNAARTSGPMYRVFKPSRGESAFLIETEEMFLAHVEEGLGTKNLVADKMMSLGGKKGKSYYDQIAQDTVAMIVNDMITIGAIPRSVAMHLAVGNSDWFKNKKRVADLISGWKKACDLARCVWGGGETPTLKNIVNKRACVLAGSAIGDIRPKSNLLTEDKIQPGDRIIIVEASGVHANGLTLCRKIAAKLPDGYLTTLPDGRTYGETLLDPTPIYVPIVEDCLRNGVKIHYCVNVTGHGWRKLTRAERKLTYVIEKLPTQLPIFDFIQKYGPVDVREMYGNYNMGAGFVLYVDRHHQDFAIETAKQLGFNAFDAGYVSEGPKQVVIKPKNITFTGDELAVR